MSTATTTATTNTINTLNGGVGQTDPPQLLIRQHVKYIYIDTVMHHSVLYWQAQLNIFVFQLQDDNDTSASGGSSGAYGAHGSLRATTSGAVPTSPSSSSTTAMTDTENDDVHMMGDHHHHHQYHLTRQHQQPQSSIQVYHDNCESEMVMNNGQICHKNGDGGVSSDDDDDDDDYCDHDPYDDEQLLEDDIEDIVIDEQEQISACRQYILPSVRFVDTWDSLMFDNDETKYNLLHYASSAMLFSDCRINTHLISWNRVMLLHGPAGTGKTSLCKALAQKLSIHLCSHVNSCDDIEDTSSSSSRSGRKRTRRGQRRQRYSHGQLIEINTHSLFSKWFSESGKLVFKLFQHVQQMVQDEDAFVCVLIDEVESLTSARQSALNGTEPSDSIRVVNAVLTQLDQLKRYRNVLILTTSNITGAIDLAFVDRADLKQYIGPPGMKARFHILKSCIAELVRVNLVTVVGTNNHSLSDSASHKRGSSASIQYLERLTFDDMISMSCTNDQQTNNDYQNVNDGSDSHLKLHLSLFKELCEKCDGFSGRSLRKLPFMAHAFFVQSRQCSLEAYLRAMIKAADREITERGHLNESSKK